MTYTMENFSAFEYRKFLLSVKIKAKKTKFHSKNTNLFVYLNYFLYLCTRIRPYNLVIYSYYTRIIHVFYTDDIRTIYGGYTDDYYSFLL